MTRSLEDNLPAVYADADKVQRSLINLVVNAIKLSNSGSTVTISAHSVEPGHVQVNITDTGPGLTEQETSWLFERFRQGMDTSRTASKGFGLGLSIVKDLVAINLGEVFVTSTPGEGSTFSFTLPRCNFEHVVDSFIQRETERTRAGMLAVLCVRRESPTVDIDELRSFVTSACYPTDIQFSSHDGQSMILIGATTEPDCWRNRLVLQDEENRAHNSTATRIGKLRVEHIGSWTLPTAKKPILDILHASKETQSLCATY